MILAGTGHRPPKLGLGYEANDRHLIGQFVLDHLSKMEGVTGVISGMAQGFDQALAASVLRLGIPLTVALPFKGMEGKWPDEAREIFHKVLSLAESVVYVSEGGYSRDKYLLRDDWMVDNSEGLIALYDASEARSGTGATVRRAVATGKPIWNLWSSWCDYCHRK